MLKTKILSDRSLRLTVAMAFLSPVLLVTVGVVGTLASSSRGPEVSNSLPDLLNKAHQGPLYTYPTSRTQGIVPVRLRSPCLSLIGEIHRIGRKESIPTTTVPPPSPRPLPPLYLSPNTNKIPD